MENSYRITKSFLKKQFDSYMSPVLFLRLDCKKILYANQSARMTYGRLAENGVLADRFQPGWKKKLKELDSDGVLFIPINNTEIFSHVRLIPLKSEGKKIGYEVSMIADSQSDIAAVTVPSWIEDSISDLKHALIGIENLEEKYANDPKTQEILHRLKQNVGRAYSYVGEKNLNLIKAAFYAKEAPTVFSLLSLLRITSARTYPIKMSATSESMARFTRIKGSFELYQMLIEEAMLEAVSLTRDTSPIKVSVDYPDNYHVMVTLFKRGVKSEIKSQAQKGYIPAKTTTLELLQLLYPLQDFRVRFTESEDAVAVTVTMKKTAQEITKDPIKR